LFCLLSYSSLSCSFLLLFDLSRSAAPLALQENILVSSTAYLKICDFGNARWLKHGTRARTLCGVPESTAPEMFVPNAAGNTTHGTAVDWWALGVLSFELNVGWSPFYSENPMDIYGRVLASPNTLHYPDTATKDQEESSAWAQAKSFTLGLLNRDETERLGASTSTKSAMHHAWMQHMEWHELLHQNVVPPRGAFFPSHDVARNFELHAPREEAVPKPLSGAKGKMIWRRWCGDL
jgi:protein kinase A